MLRSFTLLLVELHRPLLHFLPASRLFIAIIPCVGNRLWQEMACSILISHARYLLTSIWVGMQQIVKMLEEAKAKKDAERAAQAQALGDE